MSVYHAQPYYYPRFATPTVARYPKVDSLGFAVLSPLYGFGYHGYYYAGYGYLRNLMGMSVRT